MYLRHEDGKDETGDAETYPFAVGIVVLLLCHFPTASFTTTAATAQAAADDGEDDDEKDANSKTDGKPKNVHHQLEM